MRVAYVCNEIFQKCFSQHFFKQFLVKPEKIRSRQKFLVKQTHYFFMRAAYVFIIKKKIIIDMGFPMFEKTSLDRKADFKLQGLGQAKKTQKNSKKLKKTQKKTQKNSKKLKKHSKKFKKTQRTQKSLTQLFFWCLLLWEALPCHLAHMVIYRFLQGLL